MDIDQDKLKSLSSEELDALLESLESLSNRTPLDYTPHAKQSLFHLAGEKHRFLCGGNRSGKTEAGAAEAAMHSTGIYPTWYLEQNKIKGANRGRIIVTDFAKGGEVIETKLMTWIPKDKIISTKRTVKGAIEKIFVQHALGGTSVIDIMTHEQDDDVFQGWNGHWAWFDEPPPRNKFIYTLRGLIDLSGRSWLTLTPLTQPWLYDEFIAKKDSDVFFLTVSMFDNPYVPEAEKVAFASRLTEEEKEVMIEGKFRHLTGLVYKIFDPLVHIIDSTKVKIDHRWPVYFAMDPHDRKPHHGIWARVDPFNNIYIIDELMFTGTIKEVCKQILMREVMTGIKPNDVIRIGDPNKMNTPSAVNGLKFKQEFASHGVHFITNVNDDIALGHLAVSEKLFYDKSKPLSSTNHPALFFLKETTKNVVRSMQLYVWDDWKGSSGDTKGQREKPQEAHKDFMDCIRYLIMYRPTFYDGGYNEGDPGVYRGSQSITGYHG